MSIKFLVLRRNSETAEDIEISAPGETLSILEILEENGIQIPYGCREGVCGSCIVSVTQGLELLRNPGPLETDTLSRVEDATGKRLACRACCSPGASGKIAMKVG